MSEFSFQDKTKGYPMMQLRFRSSNAEAGRDQQSGKRYQEPSNVMSSEERAELDNTSKLNNLPNSDIEE